MSPTAAASTGSLPRNPRGKMPLFGRVAGYRQPPEPGAGAGAGQHRLSAVSGRSRLSGSGSGTAEIWVDSAPGGGGDKEAVLGDCSNIYGYMDEHKKAMIQQWVEGQATNLHSAPAPPSHLTGRDSLAWLQAHSSSSQLASSSCTQQPGPSCDQLETNCEQQQQQYRCLTQFKMAESSTSEASDPPDPVVRVEVEVNSVPATSAISEQRQELRTSDKNAAAGAREAAAQEGRSPSVTPGPQPRDPSGGAASGQTPPPPQHSAPAQADTRSVASAGSRASSRKSDAATNTGDTADNSNNNNNNNNTAATFHPRHQDPFGGSRRLTLPRRSPAAASREDTELEDGGSIRTLDELYR